VIPKKNVNLNPQFENSKENEAHKEQQNVDVLKEKYAFWSYLVTKHFEITMMESTCLDKFHTFSYVIQNYFWNGFPYQHVDEGYIG